MIANATVEKTTTYKLTKQQIIDILKAEAGADRFAGGMVNVKFECTGGDDTYGGYSPMDLYGATITVTEKSTT
jgi:hypothetical protein